MIAFHANSARDESRPRPSTRPPRRAGSKARLSPDEAELNPGPPGALLHRRRRASNRRSHTLLRRHSGTLAHAAVVSLVCRRRGPSRRCSHGPARRAPLLRLTALHGAKRRDWAKACTDEARKVIADPTVVARHFTESVGIVESSLAITRLSTQMAKHSADPPTDWCICGEVPAQVDGERQRASAFGRAASAEPWREGYAGSTGGRAAAPLGRAARRGSSGGGSRTG